MLLKKEIQKPKRQNFNREKLRGWIDIKIDEKLNIEKDAIKIKGK
jgi:hypothetical protein